MVRVRGRRLGVLLLVVATIAVTTSCASTVRASAPGTPTTSTPTKNTPTRSTASPHTAASNAAAPIPPAQGKCAEAVRFDPASFPQTPRVDNPWLPLIPGTRLVLGGSANRGSGQLPHQVIFTVTDLVKVIDGVPNIVVWDRDIQDGEIAEAELAFFAQDRAGNVWNLGEYPEEYESGEFAGAPSTWFTGIGDAHGGIHMKANPQAGTGWYLQGSVPSIEFLDCAQVIDTQVKACVPARCSNDIVITNETSPLDPTSGFQRKYNARGVGIIQVGAIGGQEDEVLKLTESGKLTTKELATARAAALALERHAYQTNKIYQQTKPAT